MPSCTADACKQGREPCPAPAACHVPESTPQPIRMFRPSYDVAGPYRPRTGAIRRALVRLFRSR